MSARSTPGPVPHRIGPYRIRRLLGSGGMGVVYLGQDESSGTLAAVKVLHPENAADPLLLARLRREVATARSVPRFCTAPVVAADLTADQPYVATEYIAGLSLAERVTQHGKLAGGELEGLALGVAMALRAIHDHKVVHRDLKPSNIMLSSVGPRVIDFGIARLGPVGTWSGTADTQLTFTGQTIGTLPYMSPEQVRGEEVTAATDVFAWAGVLAYAATGRPPFGSDHATPHRIEAEDAVVSGIDEPLWGLMLAAFRKEPSSRPTAEDLVRLLSLRRPAVADQVRETAAEPAQRLPPTLVDPGVVGAGAPGDGGGAGAGAVPTALAADTAPTVVRPAGPPLAARLAELLDAGRVMAAHRLVSGLAPAETPAECRELAARARAMAGRATALRDRAVAATDPDRAWQLLDEAAAQAPDLPDLAELRLRWPPHRAGTPSAHPTGTGVVVSWSPSRSHTGQVRYRTLRATRPFPAGAADGDLIAEGELIAESADCRAHDRVPPVNTPLHYAVVAQRGGVAAPLVATPTPVWFRPEVTDLSVTPGEGLVAAAWHPPPAAARISVRRGTDRPPRDAADGSPVEPAGAGFVDRGLPTGVRHHYLVTVFYLGPDGTEWHTEGVRFDAVPARSPEPVRELRLDVVAGEPGWLRAGFPAPGWGTVELRELTAPPEQPLGTRLSATELPGRPVAAVPVTGGLKLLAPAGPTVLLAATVSGELAAIGAHREWRPVPVPTGLRVQRRGDELLLTWQWPAEVGVAQVCWRAATGGSDRPPWQCQRVTAAQYRVGGGATVRPYGARRYDVSVASLVSGAYQELTGPQTTTTVEVPVAGEYTISWQGWPDRQLTLAVTARQPVRVPRLVLVAAAEWPLSPAGGEPLAEASDVALGSAQPWLLRCGEPQRRRPYWLRCFAPGGPVELRDPPRDQLRVG